MTSASMRRDELLADVRAATRETHEPHRADLGALAQDVLDRRTRD